MKAETLEKALEGLKRCFDVDGLTCDEDCPYWGTCKFGSLGEPIIRDLEALRAELARTEPTKETFTKPAPLSATDWEGVNCE